MNYIFPLVFLHSILCSRFIEEKHHFDQDSLSFAGKFFSINGNVTITLLIDIQYTYRTSLKGLKFLDLYFIMIDYEFYTEISGLKDIDHVERCRRMLHYSIYIKEIDVVFVKEQRSVLNKQEIHNNNNPTLWYFLIMDCNFHTHKLFPDFPFIITDLTVLDNTDSHFSYEEKFILHFFLILSVVFIIIFASNYEGIFKEMTKEEPNYHILSCWISLFLKLLYVSLQSIHLYVYSLDGLGNYTLEITSIILWSLSQYILESLILFTIGGLGIFYRNIVLFDNLYPTVVIVFIIQTVTLVLTEYNENSIDKFHDFDGRTGLVIIISKSFFFLIIPYLLNKVIIKINKQYSASHRLKDFYLNLAIIGILYTSSFPLLCLMVNYIDYFYRHKIVICGEIILQISCVLALLKMFGNNKSTFYEYSIYVNPLSTDLPRKIKSK